MDRQEYLAWLSEIDELSPEQRIAEAGRALGWSAVPGSRNRPAGGTDRGSAKLSALCDGWSCDSRSSSNGLQPVFLPGSAAKPSTP